MFVWFFLTTEVALPLLGDAPLADPLWLILTAVLQLLVWVAAGFWFGRLLWKLKPPRPVPVPPAPPPNPCHRR